MFTQHFPDYACPEDSITCDVGDFRVTAFIAFDPDYGIDDDDTHNPSPAVTGCDAEQQKRLMAARDAWFNDEWFYGGIVLDVEHIPSGLKRNHAASLWAVDVNYPGTDNSYLLEVANDLLPEALDEVKDVAPAPANDNRELIREILDEFDAECEAAEYTDTARAWEVLHAIRELVE